METMFEKAVSAMLFLVGLALVAAGLAIIFKPDLGLLMLAGLLTLPGGIIVCGCILIALATCAALLAAISDKLSRLIELRQGR